MRLFAPGLEPRSVCFALLCLLGASCGRHGLRRAADASADASADRDGAGVFDSPSDRGSDQPADASAFRCVPGQILSGDRAVKVAGSVSAIVLADLDRDGTTDLAATDRSNDVVVLAPGCGGGAFGQGLQLATGGWPSSLAVVDVNADGMLDLAVSNWTDNSVSILIGLGGGAFSPKVDYPVEGSPRVLVAGDFDGDGHPDLAVEWGPTPSDELAILRNRGDGSFVPLVTYQLSSGRHSLATGDLDGDGRDELAVADWGSSRPMTVFSWKDGGDATRRSIGEIANSVVIADVNGDRHRDLAWTTGRGVQVAFNRGDGTFAPAADYQAGPVTVCRSWALTVGDVNGDGRLDLLMLNDDCQVVTVVANRGDGTFADPIVYLMEDYLMVMATGDLNGDGRADLVVSVVPDYLTVLLAQPDGRFARPIVP